MSKKDGKATLLKATAKKNVFVLALNSNVELLAQEVKNACPVKIIKIL